MAAREALVQCTMLVVCLCCYTFGPLLVNWSVVVNVPPEAEATILTLPARSKSQRWYDVTLAHQPGMTMLYVEDVAKGGLADVAGVLPGDIVSRGVQEGAIVFDQSSFKNKDGLLEVQGFIENALGKSFPQANPPLIDPDKPLTLTFDMEHVDVKGGEQYLKIGLVLIRNVAGSFIWLLVYLIGFRGSFRKLYTLGNVMVLVLPGLGWTTGDLLEMLANSRTNAALYTVLSQLRLVGTAFLMRMILGKRQSVAQITCLVTLTIVILCYTQVPDSVPIGKYWNGFGKPFDPDEPEPEADNPLGILFAFAKVGVSIIMGVVGQKALQKEELKDLPMVALQALIFSAASVVVLPFTFLFMWSADWDKGIFGGYPVEFRHCLKSWDEATCNLQTPVVVEQGWDYRTVMVLCFYICRSLCLNSVLRRFDALTKNFCNATATVTTYFLSLTMLGKEFNFAKCGLTIGIMLQIVQYAFAPAVESDPAGFQRQLT